MIYGMGQYWERNLEATIAYGLVLPKLVFAILGTIEDAKHGDDDENKAE